MSSPSAALLFYLLFGSFCQSGKAVKKDERRINPAAQGETDSKTLAPGGSPGPLLRARTEAQPGVEKQALILATTADFLWKFEAENVKLLQQMGYTVHFAANLNEPAYLSEEDWRVPEGVRMHHIEAARSPYQISSNRTAYDQLLRLIKRLNIRLIHCHTPVGGVLGRLAAHRSSPRPLVVYTAHGFHFYRGAPLVNRLAYYRVEQWLARYTDVLITINREDYQNALRLPLKKGGRVYQIPGVGLDTNRFRPLSQQRRAVLRARLGIGPEEFFLVSAGELNKNKNHQVVLRAMALLRQQGAPPIRYGVCGDGFCRRELEQQIERLGLSGAVTLFGYCPDVLPFLGGADASAFPSIREGLGMAGLESLAMGIPVLASDNRGTREYMRHGENGFVCSWFDAPAFARGIAALQGMDAARRSRMALFCRSSAQPFDKAHAGAAMRRIYQHADQQIGGRAYEGFTSHQRSDGRI